MGTSGPANCFSGLEFFEAVVQELQQHKHAVGIDKERREVDEIIDAVGFEVLHHVNEEV